MESVWTEVKSAIRERIPGHSFRMWIDPIKFSKGGDGRIVLRCPNCFSRKRVQDNYGSIIESELKKVSGMDLKLVLEVEERGSKNTKNKDADVAEKKKKPVSLKRERQMKLPMKRETQLVLPDVGAPVMHGGRMLRKNFTFDDFIVSDSNNFAYSAALSLATSEKSHNSSLFLLSETGMGKSHLSQAIGHHVMNQNPSDRVYYITAEDFTNEMIGSFKNNSIDKFKEKYRTQCDVLLLEDIHFLGGKERTQIELAMTLDYLFESGKKIMFSSCYLPSDIPKMNEQLRSRFASGLISKIDEPDFRTRVRILQKKAQASGCKVPNEIIEYLASELSDNIRQLESGLVGVTAKSSLLGVPMDLDLAGSVIQNISRTKKSITIDVIKNLVSREYNISVADMVSKSRKKAIVRPRQIAIYLARKYTDQPLQTIGKNFNRYHATVMHSVGSVEKGMREEIQMRKHVEFFSNKLENGEF